jgi:hypothetical protein
MNMPMNVLALCALLCAGHPCVQAQSAAPPAAPASVAAATAACHSEVSRFEQAIGLVRQTQGNAAAAELKEKLLPAKVETEILFKDGYCGLARYLRDKKLNR